MQFVLVIASSLLWGITNPFIRKGSIGLEKIKADNFVTKSYLEFKYLFTNLNVNILLSKLFRYLVPFILNQIGSILFYIALASANLSLVVPITNSLTLLFTTIAGIALGEETLNWIKNGKKVENNQLIQSCLKDMRKG
ncbi:transmembrane protein -like [Brachionus plicatilis]|uniref:Transmembrane protein-like n=1 Tax=Brachionus plicatilis TaxID=10195 RepID=A0A3M7PWD4_BRAPC|nr:transmembrane protein -like [Brachionus plicatilis]